MQTSGKPREHLIILGGNVEGYLSPCGCTQPMIGGITRRATAIKSLTKGREALILENGGFVKDVGRQSELKAETLAEILKMLQVDAIHLTSSEAKLGRGMLMAMSRLSGQKLVSTSLTPSETNELPDFIMSGPFLVGGVSTKPALLAEALGERALAADAAVKKLVDSASEASLVPILLLEGGEKEAARLAEMFPSLALIQYHSTSDPSLQPRRVGKTLLASPGEKGKHVLKLTFRDGAIDGYTVLRLTPDFHDDPDASRIYRTYLERVDEENLLEKLPRAPGKKFSGSQACGSCHSDALKTWEGSKHAHALKTLEDENHGRDPDCVGCHVVGLEVETGFLSRKETPDLADVGCESCHGPGAEHSAKPYVAKMPKLGVQACMKCHTPENSPNFDFDAYWRKVAHK